MLNLNCYLNFQLILQNFQSFEIVEDEYFVSLDHPMTKDHYISFIAAISDQGIQMVKLYPEGPAQARFKIAGVRKLYACCKLHGLFAVDRKDLP